MILPDRPPPPPRNLYHGLECEGLKGFCIKEESGGKRIPGVDPIGVIDQQLKVLCAEALPRDPTHYSLIFNKSYF